MRHFTFVVPPLAVLAAIGFDAMIAAFGRWRAPAAVGAGIAIAALVMWNAIVLVRLHPHEYLFYNPLVGGLQGAAGRYATDYWVNVMPEAVGKLESYLARIERQNGRSRGRYNVAICAQRLQFEHVTNDRLQLDRHLGRSRFLHRADPHDVRQHARGQGDRDDRAPRRRHRRCEGPPQSYRIGSGRKDTVWAREPQGA